MLTEERMDKTMDCTIHLDRASERVIPELLGRLQRQGLHIITTFDFQLARAPHSECSCPHHGTENCNCQYVVLLVYEPQYDYTVYRTITVHGQDKQVWLSLLNRPGTPAGNNEPHANLEAKLLDTLQELGAPALVNVVQADDFPRPEGKVDVYLKEDQQV
jgi:hypothetical protein